MKAVPVCTKKILFTGIIYLAVPVCTKKKKKRSLVNLKINLRQQRKGKRISSLSEFYQFFV